jgi:hypothetical protein
MRVPPWGGAVAGIHDRYPPLPSCGVDVADVGRLIPRDVGEAHGARLCRRPLSLAENQQRLGVNAVVLHRLGCGIRLHELLERGHVGYLDYQPDPL